jgi:hypothetical protein
MMKLIRLIILLFFIPAFIQTSRAQVPTDQDCLGAIPVCEGFYTQLNSYSGSGNYPNEIPSTGGCPGNCMLSGEKNCVWYYVTVQSDGLMGFVITPYQYSDDYDWVVYNLTDARCEDIYQQAAQLQVSCNWSGTSGPTGPNGGSNSSCQPAGGTPFNAMIPVLEGQNYVINISNYSSTQYGYTLDFSMSTAQIFDDVPPVIDQVFADEVVGCNTNELRILWSESVRCDRVTPASFGITGPGGPYTVTDVWGLSCSLGGEWEKEFILYVDPPFASNGDYILHVYSTFPGIVDACNNAVENHQTPFTLNLGAPTLNTFGLSVSPATCGMENGSITGLSATGQTALSYVWKNQYGTVVGHTIDLLNVPAGTYTLEVHDLLSCVTHGGPWEIEEFGEPEIDDTGVEITAANYGAGNGSITGIEVITSFAIDSYIWKDAGGVVAGSALDLVGVGSGYYDLTVVDENTCEAYAGPYFVGEIGGPLSTSPGASPSVICQGEQSVLSPGTAGGSGSYTYSWASTPVGFSSDLQNPTVAPSQTTTYHLTVFDGYIYAYGDVTVNVNPSPLPDAGDDQVIPHGISTTLYGSASLGSGEYLYFWTPLDKLVDAAAQNPQTKNLYETTPFYLTVEDAQTGCTAAVSDEVVVEVSGGFLSTNPSVSPDSVVCIGEQFFLHANAGGGSGSYTYTWSSEPAMTLPAQPSFGLTLQEPGIYYFYALIDDGYNEAMGYARVTVQPAPDIDLGPPVQVYCPYDTLVLDAGNPGSQYLWSNGATTRTIIVGTTGLGIDEQQISVYVINPDGCEADTGVTVIFDYDACLGIAEQGGRPRVEVYPNPGTGIFNLVVDGTEKPVYLLLSDMMGSSILSSELRPGSNGIIRETFDISTRPAGMYFLKLQGRNLQQTMKIILQ